MKNQHAVALGSLGGQIGGARRAAALSPERRSEIAKQAAEARWRIAGRSESQHKKQEREFIERAWRDFPEIKDVDPSVWPEATGPTKGPPCMLCGEVMGRRDSVGAHLMCVWVLRRFILPPLVAAREMEEWKHPTKEETWIRKAQHLLSEAREMARDACRSPSAASRPAKTSRS